MHSISYYSRKVNNHIHIHRTVETVGNYISKNQLNDIPSDVPSSEELICQIDGGHLKSKDDGSRTFEALTSVIYNPKNVRYPTKDEKKLLDDNDPPRGEILSKHCAASALDDDLSTMKTQTLVAARKQGLTVETTVTALCDGASNCWNVVSVIEEQCGTIVKILDWFHIAKRFQNISLPKYLSKCSGQVKLANTLETFQ